MGPQILQQVILLVVIIGILGQWRNLVTLKDLTGNIDQARFYDRVLTAQEIELLYAETSDPTTGVIGSETWSKFLGGTGTVSFLDTGSGTGRPRFSRYRNHEGKYYNW